MKSYVMLKLRVMSSTQSLQTGAPHQSCQKIREGRYTEDDPSRPSINTDVELETIYDILYGEEAITSGSDFVRLVRMWQDRRAKAGTSFLVLHCVLLGHEAQMLRQKFSLKRNTSVQIVYSDVREGDGVAGSGVNLDTSIFKATWKTTMKEKVKTIKEPITVFLGNTLLNGIHLSDFTLDDILIMYVPTIFAEFYAHSLSALMNSLHTFTPFLDDSSRTSSRGGKVKAPAPVCCLENAVTHSQRKRMSERDQALYDSANLVASQLYNGISSYFGPQVCRDLEQRSAGLGHDLRIGLEGETVPFHNLYVARGGEVQLRRGLGDSAGFEIVCWTAYGSPEGGEFVIPGLLYKFDTGQGSTILFRPNHYYHATLLPENRDIVNEKFAVALVS
ncbi:uncharacterized protein [Physcomitrium patens]|uniref:Uncharacterized protein n=1 Tax=Physcomitrium patens TaxID=3218 RepID=A0A2K1KNP9_PHYPA|nr:uncharacterized protein LOC112281063 [Physcomitrium patens]XP_024372994.1 uncharacterized protein LOC112281063 [Physcomitrium patens]XP_024372995.1 uncharacterized protein LOC112281063 [Physcomitrium patens]XP_024372996.1 uncharacterized protein LOC112281063 [Physcomitrium patens]PNR55391.1 hypothetical protein PHYPA_006288 [Physcomitrium patens]|eukprot:XP_024372993.1 uncharacterized protein LOC112281063 [Physcomitrella patens]